MSACIGSDKHKSPAPLRGESMVERWLTDGGTLSGLIQSHDWVSTCLGDIEHWPQSLRTALSICLNSPAASGVAWGRDRTLLYNDRYQSLCGPSHSDALGHDFSDCWGNIWPALQAPFERALGGKTTLVENIRAPIAGDTAQRDAVLSFSFIPVRDENHGVGGVLITITDSAALAELKRANEDREAFNYVISHDLRSPLRSMEELTRLVLEDSSPLSPDDARLFLSRVAQAAGKLGERAEGLLSFSRVSYRPLSHHPVSVQTIVEEILAERQGNSEDARPVDVVVGELPETMGDAELIRQVFANTLSNAFKFTRHVDHPRIDIGGRRQGNQNAYVVADNGAGFDMKYAAKLFSLFHRLHSEAEFEGAGLSLALTRRIIERHGGTIWAEAKKGQGATFHFTLPAASAGPRWAA